MKILIAYYSRTGKTEKVAEALKKDFENRGHTVNLERIKPVKEHSFLGWWHIRMFKGECEIQAPRIREVSKYDAVCIGSPNWTRLSLPMAKYLREIKGLKYKNVGFFATTATPPALEWCILSAYLLDLSFSAIINKQGGRIINSILLSGLIKKWGVDSKYGKKEIKKFCDKIETPILSFKNYFLKQKEEESFRLLAVSFSALLVLSLILRFLLQVFNEGFLSWGRYFYLFIAILLTFIFLTIIKGRRIGIFFGKYIAGFSAILLWTLTVIFVEPSIGRILILGYILIFILIGFFRDQKAVIFSGFLSFLSYGILFYIYPLKEVFRPSLDIILMGLSCGVVSFITNSLQRYYYSLLDTQDELEDVRTTLEIKVAARTTELSKLTETLDEQVKERTKELQVKIDELETFQRLSVGRELKMIELKKEIEKIKEEYGKK